VGPRVGVEVDEMATTDAELTPEQAAATIEQARGYERPLRRRAGGVTVMVWALIMAAIPLTFEAASSMGASHEAWWFPFLWVPWVVAGNLVTFGIWGIAEVSTPDLERSWTRTVLYTGLFLGAGAAAWALSVVLVGGLPEPASALFAIATGWGAIGLVLEAEPGGRRAMVGIGLALLVVAIANAVTLPATGGEARSQAVIVTSALVPLAVGFWNAWTG